MIPASVERRARWVLDSIGARGLGFGDDVPYNAHAWERLTRGERPEGDAVAEAFFHLARVEEHAGARDEHGRFRAAWSCLDPLDPQLERLRRELGVEPPRWRGARFAVALSHDVDWPWRGMRGAAARLKGEVQGGHARAAVHAAAGVALAPLHRLRGTDPDWRFDELLATERKAGAGGSTFFVFGANRDPHDGVSATYDRVRPRLVETLLHAGAEIGVHGSYSAADDVALLREEKERLESLGAHAAGHRYHYLRVDPHRNLAPLRSLGFGYDSTLGFPDAIGFRAGIAQPFRPWDVDRDEPLDLVEVPLAVMDATLSGPQYLGLSARAARPQLERLFDWAAANGGGFAILWHTDRFDPLTSGGWDRLYYWALDAIRSRGGVCVTVGELAEEFAAG